MEKIGTDLVSNFSILNLPGISVVFKKRELDKIANDNVRYQRLLTTKCPVTALRQIVNYGTRQSPTFFFAGSFHASLYDDDNTSEINKRKYISDCLEKRVTKNEVSTLARMLSNGNPDIGKYILSVFLRRILKTSDNIPEVDDLVANVIPLEQTTSRMMSKYELQNKIPQVELNLLVSAVLNFFVPLVITNETVRFTKRSPLPFTLRVCCHPNDENIPVGSIVILTTGIPAYLDDDPKYIWGAGMDHRCCRIRDFAIDFFDKLDKKRSNTRQ